MKIFLSKTILTIFTVFLFLAINGDILCPFYQNYERTLNPDEKIIVTSPSASTRCGEKSCMELSGMVFSYGQCIWNGLINGCPWNLFDLGRILKIPENYISETIRICQNSNQRYPIKHTFHNGLTLDLFIYCPQFAENNQNKIGPCITETNLITNSHPTIMSPCNPPAAIPLPSPLIPNKPVPVPAIPLKNGGQRIDGPKLVIAFFVSILTFILLKNRV